MLQLLQRLTAPPGQALTTLQPTPTTVRYTVSTRPVPKTLAAVGRYYISLLLRILLGLIACLALLAKWERRGGSFSRIYGVLGLEHEAWATRAVETLQWRFFLPIVLAVLWLVLRRGYTEESLLIVRGLGIQTSSTSPSYLSTPTVRFIPTTSIQDILIHEAFIGFEVRFYLAIVVQGEQDVVVVFPKLMPRRDMLEAVWRGSRACLWGDGKGKEKERDNTASRRG